jgi:hypothetical protein
VRDTESTIIVFIVIVVMLAVMPPIVQLLWRVM